MICSAWSLTLPRVALRGSALPARQRLLELPVVALVLLALQQLVNRLSLYLCEMGDFPGARVWLLAWGWVSCLRVLLCSFLVIDGAICGLEVGDGEAEAERVALSGSSGIWGDALLLMLAARGDLVR